MVTNTAIVVVPLDANGNGIADDWEYMRFNGSMTNAAADDADGDGFPNYNEWVASTDPLSPGSYVGWDSLFKMTNGAGLRLTFQAVPGRVYHIEGNNNELPTASGWKFLGSVTNGGGNEAEWTDLSYPTNAIRHYRIKIPAFVP